jgi:hypothetical protein
MSDCIGSHWAVKLELTFLDRDLFDINFETMAEPLRDEEEDTDKPIASRGPNFTVTKDLCCAKAFIRASDDPVHGTNQKSQQFKAWVYDEYRSLIDSDCARAYWYFISSKEQEISL